jgi:hypothetical protein
LCLRVFVAGVLSNNAESLCVAVIPRFSYNQPGFSGFRTGFPNQPSTRQREYVGSSAKVFGKI